MRRLWVQASAVIGIIALLAAAFALLSPSVTAQQPLGNKPPGDQPYVASPQDLTIPGSPLKVIVRPSGSYGSIAIIFSNSTGSMPKASISG